MARSKSMIVALADIRMALKLRMVKWSLVLSAAFGPLMTIALVAGPALVLTGPELELITSFMVPMAAALLAMFSIIPATMISANALVGEREQSTLEPLLCTPLTDNELLWGKTLSSVLICSAILVLGTLASTIGIAAILLVSGKQLIVFPDLPGLFMLAVVAPIVLFGVVSLMIIISGRVQRVYEAYQMSGAIIMIFMIPMLAPIISMESGAIGTSAIWMWNFVSFFLAVIVAVVTWAIAIKQFNRDRMVSLV
ncbi:MAG: ABC transporter permease subunit [Candidatus Thorarchaeota archaeon]|nr:ABC transporter permease subunit [Candidatus Thorarchaeota archaeon]